MIPTRLRCRQTEILLLLMRARRSFFQGAASLFIRCIQDVKLDGKLNSSKKGQGCSKARVLAAENITGAVCIEGEKRDIIISVRRRRKQKC